MRIVVLDGFTLNPSDLSWRELESLGECVIHDRTTPEQILSRVEKAECVLTNKVVLTRAHFEQLPSLRYIGILATGTNVVDLIAARAQSIIVTNVPAYGTHSVAQATFALLLELTNRTGHHTQTVRAGKWSQNVDWCYWDFPLIELAGLTMGIVGLGKIGSAVAHLADAFGMNVLAYSPSKKTSAAFVRRVDLDTLFRESDVISLHCSLTSQTRLLVNAERIASMKHTSILLNTSRGQLIDENALAEALNAGKIAGAGLDVLANEPPNADNPLLRAKNCLITPHNAWATHAARARLMRVAVKNLRAFMSGRLQNVVN